MLDRQPKSFSPRPPAAAGEVAIGLPELLGFLRRQRWPIASGVAAFLLLGAAYLAVTPPTYTASATLLIDPRKVAIFGSGNVLEDASITNSGVETQVQVLESGRIAHAIVARLNLAADEAFMNSVPTSPVSVVRGWVSAIKRQLLGSGAAPAAAPTAADLAERAVGILSGRLNATRVGLSYAISVSYQSADAQQAARLANAATEAYLDDQIQAQVGAAERASAWLQGRLTDLQDKAADTKLTAQEKSAIRATYDTFLERYTQTVQQQSLPFADAQVLTAAVPPSSPSSPNKLVVVLGSLFAGLSIGFGIALARDLLDRRIRTPSQVEAATGVTVLGLLPRFDMSPRAMRRIARRTRRLADPASLRFAAGPAYSIVLTAPFSRYAETLRGAKVAAEAASGGPATVLGIVSAIPNEGRSTVAANLARLIAQEGARTILIDGDLRNPNLSRTLVPAHAPGLVQIMGGAARLSEVTWTDQATQLRLLPAGADADTAKSGVMLNVAAIKAVINACRQQYDSVIVDLPAMMPVVDVRAAAHLFDGFLLVVEWGYTSEEILTRAIQAAGLDDKVVGAVLNKVNLRLMRRFGTSGQAAVSSGNYLRAHSHIA